MLMGCARHTVADEAGHVLTAAANPRVFCRSEQKDFWAPGFEPRGFNLWRVESRLLTRVSVWVLF